MDLSVFKKWEINEYTRSFNNLIDELESIQNKAKRLNNLDINEGKSCDKR